MENRLITFEEAAVRSEAEKHFILSCGLDRKGARFQKMRQEGFSLRERMREDISVKGVLMRSTDFRLSENILTICGVPFCCNAFERMNFEDVSAVYTFIITSGDYGGSKGSISEQFYADTWGTAYVEGGRMALKALIQAENPKKFVPDSFGPGFFGMPIQEVGSFFRLLDGQCAGICQQESGIMMPVKSLAGLFLVMERACNALIGDCASCIGNKEGCQFCSLFQRYQDSDTKTKV